MSDLKNYETELNMIINEIKGIIDRKNPFWISVYRISEVAVRVVEDISKSRDDLRGQKKLELAIDIVNYIIDHIKLPVKIYGIPIPAFLIKRAIKSALKGIIEGIVDKLNKDGTFKH